MIRKFDTFIIREAPAGSNGNGHKHYEHAVCFIDVDDISFAFPTEIEGFKDCYNVSLKSGPGFVIVNVDAESFIDPLNAFLGVVNAGYAVMSAWDDYQNVTSDIGELADAIDTLGERLDRSEAMVP